MTASPEESTQRSVESPNPRRKGRGKSRSFDFSAIEHVGNDATEGGFLGDDAAESERRGGATAVVVPPSLSLDAELPGSSDVDGTGGGPALSAAASVAPEAAPIVPSPALPRENEAPLQGEPEDEAKAEAEPEPEPEPEPEAEPEPKAEAEAEAIESRPANEPAEGSATPTGARAVVVPPTGGRRRNDGPGFTAASAEPALRPRSRKKAADAKPPMQAAVLASFIRHRTGRDWPTWSGRIEGETKARLLNKADDDALSSGRNLMPGHYLDAALKLVQDQTPEQLAAMANEWLIERWSGEHPPGVSIQAGVSPEMYTFLKGLKRHLRGQRGAGSGGLILDVVSAAVDRFLDDADGEGPFPPAR